MERLEQLLLAKAALEEPKATKAPKAAGLSADGAAEEKEEEEDDDEDEEDEEDVDRKRAMARALNLDRRDRNGITPLHAALLSGALPNP